MEWPKVAAVGLVLGVVAGLVVWYLERFEIERMYEEIGTYLGKYDQFREWESQRGN